MENTVKIKNAIEVVENYIKEDLCVGYGEEITVRLEGEVIVITGESRWEVGLDTNDYHFGMISLYNEEIEEFDLDPIMDIRDNRGSIVNLFKVEMGYEELLSDDKDIEEHIRVIKEKTPNCNLEYEVGKYVWTTLDCGVMEGVDNDVVVWCEKHCDEIKKWIKSLTT